MSPVDPNARSLDEAKAQLLSLLQQQEEFTPALYRDLALYLQVLRDGLLHSVQQACFHLATQVVPERYNQLPPERRQTFQRRLQSLVKRSCSLLTVEQVMVLAAQQTRKQQRRQLQEQQKLLQSMLEGRDPAHSSPTEALSPSEPAPAEQAPQSVNLSLDLPLTADLFDSGVPGLPPLTPPRHASEEEEASPEPAPPEGDLALLQSLFAMASETLNTASSVPENSEAEEEEEEQGDSGSPLELLSLEVTSSHLPKDPLLQVRWWAHFDRALRRRLRNLSHAINVEMMRVGLAQGLLPLNLLDAVLDGQVEALPAPANVLRIALPLSLNPAAPASAPSEVLTLLLRSADLEFEQPRLRTCRQRLEQRRRTLRTMAKRYRTWQRRVSALEAEQQWFQDSAPPQDPARDRI
ncbi:hypothetical protein MY494_01305 [Synechococcus sp. A10-1-5-1]|uniref:hypothetical protein n=1 Tax=Synechococcus sp. A10-1-5-1 TaxID=2936507 RepID=UPI002001CCDC|nr:hypothetical protein [Synechococcus sp. A10-1-5-1]UPM50469.1 hypothetical protein MY494_01305 [Synechococcus sp. A10-1-5-1]